MDRINFDKLSEEQRELAELLGPDRYRRLIEVYGGCLIYIPKPDGFIRSSRNEKIRKQFDGYNYRELARKYKLSEQMVRNIVDDMTKELRARPPEGQLSLYNEF